MRVPLGRSNEFAVYPGAGKQRSLKIQATCGGSNNVMPKLVPNPTAGELFCEVRYAVPSITALAGPNLSSLGDSVCVELLAECNRSIAPLQPVVACQSDSNVHRYGSSRRLLLRLSRTPPFAAFHRKHPTVDMELAGSDYSGQFAVHSWPGFLGRKPCVPNNIT